MFWSYFLVLGKSPKLGQQLKFGWANFFPNFGLAKIRLNHLWLGQFFPLFCWAKAWLLVQFLLGQSLAAGPVLAGPLLAQPKILPSHNCPSQIYFHFFFFAQPFFFSFGWAKNSCGWPSQTGFSPTLVFPWDAPGVLIIFNFLP